MEYTVQKLANLAGISSRTLRYYDEIEILKPAKINSSGYRIYGKKEVDKLQQILFYRELGMDLDSIKTIITSSSFNEITALMEHRKKLLAEKEKINILIANIDNTLASKEGRIIMSDKEKFEGFKQTMIDDNEEKYGKEARERYGDEVVEKSNKKFKNMTEDQYEELQKLSSSVIDTLKLAFDTKDPAGEIAQKAADLHRQWLSYYWDSYSREAHANLTQMYVDDERFKAYYDKEQAGLAEFLRDAIAIYANSED
ncbi:MerR family transcriptional regulator [Tissierella sp.]|uniref:MerR family transcriptional regulator n=1 Tax=Tissierella sp. TaxID=41274 RepID=UPI0028654F14|nr:MerR family transcriptional regulator [Tissierella sp.]MDR7855034.1 MerR family transcriptional regulator [Tissierella sp.]